MDAGSYAKLMSRCKVVDTSSMSKDEVDTTATGYLSTKRSQFHYRALVASSCSHQLQDAMRSHAGVSEEGPPAPPKKPVETGRAKGSGATDTSARHNVPVQAPAPAAPDESFEQLVVSLIDGAFGTKYPRAQPLT